MFGNENTHSSKIVILIYFTSLYLPIIIMIAILMPIRIAPGSLKSSLNPSCPGNDKETPHTLPYINLRTH